MNPGAPQLLSLLTWIPQQLLVLNHLQFIFHSKFKSYQDLKPLLAFHYHWVRFHDTSFLVCLSFKMLIFLLISPVFSCYFPMYTSILYREFSSVLYCTMPYSLLTCYLLTWNTLFFFLCPGHFWCEITPHLSPPWSPLIPIGRFRYGSYQLVNCSWSKRDGWAHSWRLESKKRGPSPKP